MNCTSFNDYRRIYLTTHVLVLVDAFENFRTMWMNFYQLNTGSYLTSPGLALDALFMLTGAELDLIIDLEVLRMVVRQNRGGLWFVGSKRHVEANGHYLPKVRPKP